LRNVQSFNICTQESERESVGKYERVENPSKRGEKMN
jgi:hypothetical protein